ncbi:MAG: hypothetical protein H2057_02590 [Alphaproteobacteria bacterium]|nr:hypothetical protein [Alphaproteobacteria bacterium]
MKINYKIVMSIVASMASAWASNGQEEDEQEKNRRIIQMLPTQSDLNALSTLPSQNGSVIPVLRAGQDDLVIHRMAYEEVLQRWQASYEEFERQLIEEMVAVAAEVAPKHLEKFNDKMETPNPYIMRNLRLFINEPVDAFMEKVIFVPRSNGKGEVGFEGMSMSRFFNQIGMLTGKESAFELSAYFDRVGFGFKDAFIEGADSSRSKNLASSFYALAAAQSTKISQEYQAPYYALYGAERYYWAAALSSVGTSQDFYLTRAENMRKTALRLMGNIFVGEDPALVKVAQDLEKKIVWATTYLETRKAKKALESLYDMNKAISHVGRALKASGDAISLRSSCGEVPSLCTSPRVHPTQH